MNKRLRILLIGFLLVFIGFVIAESHLSLEAELAQLEGELGKGKEKMKW